MPLKEPPIPSRVPLETVVPLKAPFTIAIDTCGVCNLACNFCPCNTSDYKKEERHQKMSWEFFVKIIDDIKEFDVKLKYISLYGYGEPLLHEKIVDMIAYTKKADVAGYVEITTNGLLLSREISEKLVNAGLDQLKVSLNGLTAEDYQNSCSRQVDVEKVRENIEYLYCISRGKLKLLVKGTNQFVKSEQEIEVFKNSFASISDYCYVEDIIENWGELRIDAQKYNELKIGSFDWMKVENICTAPLIYLMVHASGIVSPCSTDWGMDMPMGNVKEESLQDIWQGEKIRKLQLSLLRQEKGVFPNCDVCEKRNRDEINDVAPIMIDAILKKSGEIS